MNLKCPKCRSDLDQDFGVVNCSRCGSVLAIDMDGNVQLAGGGQTPSGTQTHTKSQTVQAPQAQSTTSQPPQQQLQEIISQDLLNEVPEYASFANIEVEVPVPQEESFQLQPPAAEISSPIEVPIIDQSELPPGPDKDPDLTPQESANVFQAISDFGNSELKPSAISYTMKISCIDMGNLREAVVEALSHPKFRWEFNVSERIRSGTLILENLPPAKAIMVVKRLRGIDVQVSWRQDIYS